MCSLPALLVDDRSLWAKIQPSAVLVTDQIVRNPSEKIVTRP